MNQEFFGKAGKILLFVFCVAVLVTVYVLVVMSNWQTKRNLQPMSYKNEMSLDCEGDACGEMMDVSQQLGGSLAKSSAPADIPNRGMMNPDQTSTDATVSIDQKVIKTGNLSLRVDAVDLSVNEITKTVNALGGLIASSNFSNNGRGAKSGVITVRVPVAKFDEAFTKLKQSGSFIVSESIFGQDVTEQVIDMEARIKNKRAEEDAYANILKVQTQKVTDILEVTQALNTVRGEIESLQGQLKYLNSQADMSTITIALSEEPQVGKTDTTWRPLQVVKSSINALLQNLQGLVNFLIRFIIVALPILFIVFGFLGLLFWWIAKKVIRVLRRD